MNEVPTVKAAAATLRQVVSRLMSDGGILEQAEHEQSRPHAPVNELHSTADLLGALAEHVRATRPAVASASDAVHQAAFRAVEEAADTLLPFNRKERYFTGTVLPVILAHDGFAHVGRFLELVGLPRDLVQPGRDGLEQFQLFSEYSFAESLHTAADRARFAGAPIDKDTPDLVLCGRGWLLAVEAKVYDVPSRAAMLSQMRRQQVLVEFWAERLALPPDRVVHALLVPAALARELDMGREGWPVVTWEEVADAYRPVGPQHFTAVLDVAVDRYESLRATPLDFGRNADAKLTGAEIMAAAQGGVTEYHWMGRMGGLNGPTLAEDIRTGRWGQTSYEVRREPLERPNWFPVEAFLSRLPQGAE